MVNELVIVKVGHLYIKRVLHEDKRGLYYVEINGNRAYVEYNEKKDLYKVTSWED